MKRTLKRGLSIVLGLLVCFACIPTVSMAADAGESEHLTEVPDGYIGIYTKEDLMSVHYDASAKYILMNDIIFKYSDFNESYNDGRGWIPFPEFSGTFDGNGYKIANIRISGSQGNVGLFSSVRSEATVTNLFLENIKIDVTGNYVGGITGSIVFGSRTSSHKYTITNCCVSGDISGNQLIGGICGYVGVPACQTMYTILNCCNAALVSGNSQVGGILGRSWSGSQYSGYTGSDGSSSIMCECVNTGTVKGTSNIGGIVGCVAGNYSSGTYGGPGYGCFDLVDSFNCGDVIAGSVCAGIIGGGSASKNHQIEVTRCYNSGNIVSEDNVNYGAILGFTRAQYSNIYYINDSVSGATVNIGTALTRDKLSLTDLGSSWTRDGRDDYPYPELNYTKLLFPHDETHKHEFYLEKTTEATHLSDGIKLFRCDCGEFYTESIEKIQEHTYKPNITYPTCTDKGYTTYICECGDSYISDYVNSTGHTEVKDEAIKSTCTTNGKTEGSHCSVCGDVLMKQSVLPASGHTHSDWIKDSDATCTESGMNYKKCLVCGETVQTEELPALGHVIIKDEAIEPTCTSTGKTEGSHCVVCGDVIEEQKTIYATGHTIGDWVEDSEVSCTTDGSKHIECITCGKVLETKVVPAKGHTTVKDAAVPATCTTAGKTEGSHCSVCNTVIKAQTTVDALAHTSSDWVIDIDATVTTEGSKHKECTVCGETLETEVIPQLKTATPKVKAVNTIAGMKVTWNAVGGAVKYALYKRLGTANSWTYVTTMTGTSYVDNDTPLAGSYYVYTVKAYNSAGISSEYIKANCASVQRVVAPKTGAANAINGINVSWAKVAGANKYVVLRRIGTESTWKILGETTGTAFLDKNVTAGIYYLYSIRAVNNTGYSEYDINKRITIQCILTPTVTATNLVNGIQVTWNAVTSATKYNVYRRVGGSSSWVLVGTTTGTSLVDKGVTNGKYYVYSIRAINGTGYSAFDTNKTDTIQPITAPVTKVANKTTGVQVSWNKVTGATKYNVYRRLGGTSTWIYVGTTTGTTLLDKGVIKGKSYAYSIRAINGTGYSAYNSSKCAAIKYT